MKPLQPVIKWSGSKRTVASQLGEFFLPANTYYEPFVGGGAMMNMPLIIDGKEYPGPVHVEYAEIINIGFGTQYDMTDMWFNLPDFQQINI